VTYTWDASKTVQYLYDGDQAIAELQGSAIGATYLTGLQIDEVLARYGASGDRTLIADALGSVLAQTDGAGAVQTQYRYSPYGETQTTGTNDANPVQYTGRENDQTGLYYYRARYYDPQLKRFISEDPIGLGGGVNQYAYVGGNPINFIDPWGLKDRLINSQPAGPNGPQITFNNDVRGGPSTNLAVDENFANMIETVATETGLSFNINSTRGGHHARTSRHYQGKACDINQINGRPVNPQNPLAKVLQDALQNQDDIRENFGPASVTKTLSNGDVQNMPQVSSQHRTHIHVSGQ